MGTQNPNKDSLPGGGSTLVSMAAWGRQRTWRTTKTEIAENSGRQATLSPQLENLRCLQPWQSDLGEIQIHRKTQGVFYKLLPHVPLAYPRPSLAPGAASPQQMGTLGGEFPKGRQGQSGTWKFLPSLKHTWKRLPNCLLSVPQMGPEKSSRRRRKVAGRKQSTQDTHQAASDGGTENKTNHNCPGKTKT